MPTATVTNTEIARILSVLADLVEMESGNEFRARAYRTAARAISEYHRSLTQMVERGENLAEVPGVGKSIAAKIVEIARTGSLQQLAELENRFPPRLLELERIGGLGAKRVAMLYRALGVTTLADLKKAAEEHAIRGVPGFGAKTEQNILDAIARLAGAPTQKRYLLYHAEGIAEPLLQYLKRSRGVGQAVVAGSYRRRRDTVGDLDILVTASPGSDVMERFTRYYEVTAVLSRGETHSIVILRNGVQADVRLLPEESYGAALQYFTGAKEHSVVLRGMGIKKGLKINEYGVFRGDERIGGATEAEVYGSVGLPFIEPELRENRGELEAAVDGSLPDLVRLEDIKGDLHSHTPDTDGRNSIEEMARAAKMRGYQYLAITDHSQRLAMVRGLDADRLLAQRRRIDLINESLAGFRLLKGIEVDIFEDGSLDLTPEVLEQLDIVVCSVHHRFNLPEAGQTARVIKALRHPLPLILAHPTGRLLERRDPYQIDMKQVLQVAREVGCAVELNAQPDRLDLHDLHCKMAKDMGVPVVISSDAHATAEFGFMRFGVGQARRGWLEPGDVLNTRPAEAVLAALRRR